MNKFWTTFNLTYMQKVKSKSFIIMTAIFMIFVFALSNVDKIIDFFDNDSKTVAIQSDNDMIYKVLEKQYKQNDDIEKVEKVTLEKGKKGVKDEKYKRLIEVKVKGEKVDGKIYEKGNVSESEKMTLQSTLSQMQSSLTAQKLNLSEDDLKTLNTPSDVKTEEIKSDKDKQSSDVNPKVQALNSAVVYIIIFLSFFITINYANQIGSEIATEKTTRVIEMIVTSVKPSVHVTAKILAIISVAFTQIFFIVLAIVISIFAFDLKGLFESAGVEYGPETTRIIVYGAIFLILGVISYISLAAILGALTSRIEDLAQSMMPVTFISLGAFYIAIFSISNPDTMLVKITSFIPMLSPMVMLLRTTSESTPEWHLILGIVISIVTCIILLLFAARTYRGSVLTYEKGIIKNLKNALNITK
ncbi:MULTISPECIES: ABC transporter permease [Mammaliicoccus]|uniref:ABC transporter permease n=1 Tax=Mammaliicoccus fleurettii TaxID=150056 RepID=A0ABS5MNA6_9STAP|nr:MULTISPECIES: ABC transporter permease [Mammaliicoccus]HCN60510.1 ABC transporter permease [Staphylococcus sp.]MBL0847724.1 ABC transporter permease [Mammaliicoccus fleurettii]MBO3063791.1 ABC transporter permease [Mammaliicoccus fleurettii]MBS3672546.1 ABC transporter permease [Mammaliicoccus fleurettii]MBS3697410.1 ABC transporter permease [Mammaliicoccus fleurettii]